MSIAANTRDQLIALGHARGYVTYDEINEAMSPVGDDFDAEAEDTIAEVDEWVTAFEREGIKICATVEDATTEEEE